MRKPPGYRNPVRSPAIALLLLSVPLVAGAESLFPNVDLQSLSRFEAPAVSQAVEVKPKAKPVRYAQSQAAGDACRFFEEIEEGIGGYSRNSLLAMAKTVFGEASMDPDEQCAVALTVANRARDWDDTVVKVSAEPGQFHGYSTPDRRRDCEKLQASSDAVVRFVKAGGRCSFGKPNFLYFCASWALPKSKRRKAQIIGETAFLADGPC